jgi:hypothetical protein
VSRSCGCLKNELIAARSREQRKHRLTPGDKFAKWTVLDPGGRSALCRCDCGTERRVVTAHLVNGLSRSCGCLADEARVGNKHNHQHGMSKHPLYDVWCQMRRRCADPNNKDWPNYGGRGIRVYAPWLEVATFIREIEALLGTRPKGRSIDRINNDGNYEPGNVRWATNLQQVYNRGIRIRGSSPVRLIRVEPEQAAEIVRLVAAGRPQIRVAEQFGISRWRVGRIVSGARPEGV